MILGTLQFVLVGVVILCVGLRRVEREDLERFAAEHALHVTRTNGAFVLDYLARGRYHRTVGAVGGYIVAIAIGLSSGSVGLGPALAAGFAGYLFGALVTELGLSRRRTQSGPRAASLVPREVGDYVSEWALQWPPLLAGAALAAFAAHVMFARHSLLATSAAAAALVVGVLLLLRGGLRYIVTRPQPLDADDVVAADEAVRSAAMHVVAATGVAVMSILVAIELWTLAAALGSLISALPYLAGVVAAGFGIGTWRDLRNEPFRVRRPSPSSQ